MLNPGVKIEDGITFEILIQTRNGTEKALVDLDHEAEARVINRWYLYKDPKGRKMARAGREDDQVLLHRLLFDIPPGHKLEWLNGNTLDCRRKNLQLVEIKTGQIIPLFEPEIRQKSNTRGVYFHKASSKWHASAFHKGKRYSLGYFGDMHEAELEVLVFREEGPSSPKLKRNQRGN
ncbi:hypothetical protein [Cytobacillus praedii]|uniref:hypothetical protein n=1 Tax=Cytobacillus praedii TaxID=1742358 RepID=UPI002E1B76A2|nr:AP2 domain-containing protein [Cytobacillus praedii]